MTGPDGHEERTPEAGTRSELSGSASDVVQARDVQGGVHFYGPRRMQGPIPRQLPADVRGFVNRIAELDRLDKVLAGDLDEPLVVGLSVIAGTAGVGKTSLALRWAHRVRERFPDGQLYVNLRGYDPGQPVAPEQVLDYFLRALNVPSSAIPGQLDAKASLYRSLVADRRILVILDNAATVGQVRPLLPGTASCLVVVTSRSRLSGLVSRDGAHRLTLDVLSESEAVTLLRSVTAGYRTEDDAETLVELARLCARLPLALRIAAERAARRPGMFLEELIRDLRDESVLWNALSSGDGEEADAVRTVFAWSYRALPGESARVFRLLGLHPGSEFSTAAAAALTGISTGHLRQLLDVLVGTHLLEQNVPDRYQFHDLLRVYAVDQAHQEETVETCHTALLRVLTWYLYGADAVQSVMNPLEPRVSLDSPPDIDVTLLTFADLTEATRWYEAERANLVAATRAAADAGLYRIAWQLPVVLRNIYMNFNPFEDWFTTTRIGLDAARHLGNRGGEAELLESLAMAYIQSHRLDQGAEHYRAVLAIRRELGDRFGEALVLNGLGLLYIRRRNLQEARLSFEQSLLILRELGNPYWEALVMGNLGNAYYELGDFSRAIGFVRQVIEVYRDQGDRHGEGDALYILSMIHRELGQPEEALQSVRRAIAIAREHGNPVWEAYWLLEYGRVQRTIGETANALVSYQRAAMLQRQLGDRSREAQALDGTGETYRELGRYEEAADFHRLAVAAHRELSDGWQLAVALNNLATSLHHAGSTEEARHYWQDALSILADFDDPKATRIRRRISDILEAN